LGNAVTDTKSMLSLMTNSQINNAPPHSDLCMAAPATLYPAKCKTVAMEIHAEIDFTSANLPAGLATVLNLTNVNHIFTTPAQKIVDLGKMNMTIRTCFDSFGSPTVNIPKLATGRECVATTFGDVMGITGRVRVCACNDADSCNKQSFTDAFPTNVNGVWSAWHSPSMGDCCLNSNQGTETRTCMGKQGDGLTCLTSGANPIRAMTESRPVACACVPINGNWSAWELDTYKGSCCANSGVLWYIRYCREPQPAWGGKQCVKSDNATLGITEFKTISCKCDPDAEEVDLELAAMAIDPTYLGGVALLYGWTLLIPLSMLVVLHACIFG